MKLSTNQKNGTLKITHSFELAGKRATISIRNWSADEGWVSTQVEVDGQAPLQAAAFHVADAETAGLLTQEAANWFQQDGTVRPRVNEGDIMDCGACHNTGQIQELCEVLKLNPQDLTDYELVDLSVRAASIVLARKIALHTPRRPGLAARKSSVKRKRK